MARRVLRIDPREYYPQLNEIMSDLQVEAWNDDPHCLCGCGTPTLWNNCAKRQVPYGAYRLWAPGHSSRAPWYRPALADLTPEQEARRRAGIAARKDTIDSSAISIMVHEWTRTHMLKDLAAQTGLTKSHLSMIANHRRKRLGRATAARILVALNEPLRPEMRAAYEDWLAKQPKDVL